MLNHTNGHRKFFKSGLRKILVWCFGASPRVWAQVVKWDGIKNSKNLKHRKFTVFGPTQSLFQIPTVLGFSSMGNTVEKLSARSDNCKLVKLNMAQDRAGPRWLLYGVGNQTMTFSVSTGLGVFAPGEDDGKTFRTIRALVVRFGTGGNRRW